MAKKGHYLKMRPSSDLLFAGNQHYRCLWRAVGGQRWTTLTSVLVVVRDLGEGGVQADGRRKCFRIDRGTFSHADRCGGGRFRPPTFNVFEDVKDGVELKADSEDDENAVAQNVADLVGVKALDHDPDPHHHARKPLRRGVGIGRVRKEVETTGVWKEAAAGVEESGEGVGGGGG